MNADVTTVKIINFMAGVPPGKKMHLMQLHQMAKDVLSYRDIPPDEMDEMVQCLEEKWRLEKKGIWSRPAAHVRDVQATTTHVTTEVSSLMSSIAIHPIQLMIN
jgi:hypothetical protein